MRLFVWMARRVSEERDGVEQHDSFTIEWIVSKREAMIVTEALRSKKQCKCFWIFFNKTHDRFMAAPEQVDLSTPSNAPVELTILMPCLNENETIAVCLRKARSFINRTGISAEVLVADNGSTDGSQEIAATQGARVIHAYEKGYGAALLAGIAEARGIYVIIGDADDSYDFSDLDDFVQKLRSGYDFVIGNRYLGGIMPQAMPFLHRYLGNPVLSFIGRLFFDISVGDFHCGLRGFRTDAVQRLKLHTTGMEFASEMVVRSALAGFTIAEVPTTLKPDGRSRPPHLNTWRDGWRHLKFLLVHCPTWLFTLPGLFMVGSGICLSSLLFFGPVALTRNVTLDVNTFATACFLVLLGFQFVLFGGLAKYYAATHGLLPTSAASELLDKISIERLLLASAAAAMLGLGLFAFAVAQWADTGFQNLTDPIVPRTVIGGLTLVVLGMQAVAAAFFLAILRTRKLVQPSSPPSTPRPHEKRWLGLPPPDPIKLSRDQDPE
jgi:hypothetical protein